jgi:hypothetical protein
MKKKDHPILVGKTKETVAKLTGPDKPIKPKGIAKPSSVSKPKPLPAKLNTQKMMKKSIEGGKELKAAKRKSRRETAAMALGGLAATAGTILTDFRWKGNKKKL